MFSFTPTAQDADGDALKFSVQGMPTWTQFNTATGKLNGVPGPGDIGTFKDIVIRVSDGQADTQLKPFDVTVVPVGRAVTQLPTISGTPSLSVNVGDNYDFLPVAADADGDPLTFAIQNRPAWATFDAATGRLHGTPSAGSVGIYANISISVSDGNGAVSLAPFAIAVNAVTTNSAPTIAGNPQTSVLQDALYSFTPTASDADGDSLTFSISNAPAWAAFDTTTGELRGTPRASDVGVYNNIAMTVTDGQSNAVLPSFSITVTGVNAPPTISGTAPSAATTAIQYTFQPSASDADGDALTFSIQNRPVWASFDSTTGRLQGTPAAGDVGTHGGIVITVSDGTDTASLPAFSILVTATNAAPTISGTPPSTIAAGAAYSFTPTANDSDGDTLTFTIQNRPSWASFDASTGRLSGTPSSGQVGVYSGIVISVGDGRSSASLPAFAITVTSAGGSNSAPTISGSPPSSVLADATYAFTPTANDADGDTLSFSVANLPTWASFDSTTGRIQGTPGAGDVGSYTNILVSVSDGAASASLPAFGITVSATAAGSVTLSWQPPTQNEDGSPLTDLAGYKIHWGTTSGNYTSSATLNNPGITTYVVENLASGTYFFAMQSFNSQGLDSAYSGEASKTIP